MTPAKGSTDGPRVVVAGGGLAGMTAALALAKRNCQVTLYEEKEMLGGNVASRSITKRDGKDVYFDVYPHMYQPWYRNFWQLMEQVGINPDSDPELDPDASFIPFRCFFQLRKGEFPHFTHLEDAYSAGHLWKNLLSGVGSPGDMLVFGYAGLDLVAERMNPTVRLSNMSMGGFLNARTYMTRGALDAYETFITRVWAIPSYLASAEDCRTYLTFCLPAGDKPSRLTREPAIDAYLARLEKALKDEGVKIEPKKRIERVVCAAGTVSEIFLQKTRFDPKTEAWVGSGKATSLDKGFDYLVLAVPPATLIHLTRNGERGERIVDEEPRLATLIHLGSKAVPMLHLCFKDKLKDIPEGPVGLFGSALNLAFTDISQSWRGAHPLYEKKTVLAVSCSEPAKLVGPATANGQMILEELWGYLGLKGKPEWNVSPQIEWTITSYHENGDAKLSLNAIGTEDARPKAKCEALPNLFIAGDFCQHYVGMTTVEAAVVSGLAAARDLAEDVEPPLGEVEILAPETWPDGLYVAARYAWSPSIVAAKAWALAGGEWAEAMAPVDVGQGDFAADVRFAGGERRPHEDESLLRYLLTPGLTARSRRL